MYIFQSKYIFLTKKIYFFALKDYGISLNMKKDCLPNMENSLVMIIFLF